MKRIVYFDYLRAIAILGIVICHFCYNFHQTTWLGNWCGATFNALFLTMSALLLGKSWDNKNKPKYTPSFLLHRFHRLNKSYYPFLVIMFIFCLSIGGYNIRFKDIVMHFAYLPWFDKINGFGHLWFITMIAICYITTYIITQIQYIKLTHHKLLLYTVVIVAALISSYLLYGVNLPGYITVYLALFEICFIEANNICKLFEQYSLIKICIMLTVIIVSMIAFYTMDIPSNIQKLIGIGISFSIFGIVSTLLNNANNSKIITFIADISFEIYLVHHIIAFGRFSIMNIIDNKAIGFILLITISIVFGWCLKMISNIKLFKSPRHA